MTMMGQVRNGVVVLGEGVCLPEGATVRVELVEAVLAPKPALNLWHKVIGMAKDLPPDLAENHDHYLHGRPKR